MKVRGMGRTARTALAVAALAMMGGAAKAATIKPTTLVDLLKESEAIVVGSVTEVTDGVEEHGLPYTEIKIGVEENLRGNVSESYTFRQIGLQVVRPSDDAAHTMMPAPEGMPKYVLGERVMLFVGEQASMTGLRTTVGLGEGKFNLDAGRAENDYSNAGTFSNVSVESGLATANDTRMLETKVGAVNDDDFLSLVKRAVSNRWVETCLMWNTDEGKTCTGGSPRRGLTGKTVRSGKTYETIQIKAQ